jgi:hypothetical protein
MVTNKLVFEHWPPVHRNQHFLDEQPTTKAPHGHFGPKPVLGDDGLRRVALPEQANNNYYH